MGQSLTPMLIYGIKFDFDDEKSAAYELTEDKNQLPDNFERLSDAWRITVNTTDGTPLIVELHKFGYYESEIGRFVLGIEYNAGYADWDALEFDPLVLSGWTAEFTSTYADAIKQVCEKYEIEYSEPKWYFTAYYG